MLFNSLDFAIFFLVVWPIQYCLPHRPRNLFLLAASCFFYAYWDWRFLGLMGTTIIVDYSVALALEKSSSPLTRRCCVAVSLIVNFGLLAFFKYATFFASTIGWVSGYSGLTVTLDRWDIVLPLGISFYTFQSVSYVIDVYRRQLSAIRKLSDYALFVTLFPQLVAGPIERGAHLASQILHRPSITWLHCSDGAWLVLKGLFKKCVVADNLAPIVERVFASESPSAADVIVGLYAFAFQIYGDFAGYTDMARGLAKWMGYDLMLNFRLPYFSRDPSEFWQRWHISLSSWLRDYLYIPLGGNRYGRFQTCRNLMLTMTLGGLWHGANWTFVMWGVFHGLLLIAFRVLRAKDVGTKSIASKPTSLLSWWCQVILMFHLVCFGWLCFRATSLQQIGTMLSAVVTDFSVSNQVIQEFWQIAILCFPLVWSQLLAEKTGDLNAVRRLSLAPRSLVYIFLLVAILTLGNFGGREFIYFQF